MKNFSFSSPVQKSMQDVFIGVGITFQSFLCDGLGPLTQAILYTDRSCVKFVGKTCWCTHIPLMFRAQLFKASLA